MRNQKQLLAQKKINNTRSSTLSALFKSVLIIGASVLLFNCKSTAGISKPEKIGTNNSYFTIEYATTPETRRIGLMNRSQLDLSAGMLFVFPTPRKAPFWMKDTLIPLDIIWMNDKLEISYIKHNATPLSTESIMPPKAALYVLEINGGLTQKLGIKVGDQLHFK